MHVVGVNRLGNISLVGPYRLQGKSSEREVLSWRLSAGGAYSLSCTVHLIRPSQRRACNDFRGCRYNIFGNIFGDVKVVWRGRGMPTNEKSLRTPPAMCLRLLLTYRYQQSSTLLGICVSSCSFLVSSSANRGKFSFIITVYLLKNFNRFTLITLFIVLVVNRSINFMGFVMIVTYIRSFTSGVQFGAVLDLPLVPPEHLLYQLAVGEGRGCPGF